MHHNTENYFQISYEIFIRTVIDRNGTIFFIIFGIKFHNYLFIYLVEQILSLYVMSCTSSESALWLTLYQGTHCLKHAQYLEFKWQQQDSNPQLLTTTYNHNPNWPNDWASLWVLTCSTHLTVCHYHVTYTFQSESTLCSCLNVKELLTQNRHDIWSLSDSRVQINVNKLNRKKIASLKDCYRWETLNL